MDTPLSVSPNGKSKNAYADRSKQKSDIDVRTKVKNATRSMIGIKSNHHFIRDYSKLMSATHVFGGWCDVRACEGVMLNI